MDSKSGKLPPCNCLTNPDFGKLKGNGFSVTFRKGLLMAVNEFRIFINILLSYCMQILNVTFQNILKSKTPKFGG